jgi:hypothetical protein
MWCIVCHYIPIDVNVINVSHGKNKDLMSYNKDHGTFSLKKHVSYEHLKEGRRWDLLP